MSLSQDHNMEHYVHRSRSRSAKASNFRHSKSFALREYIDISFQAFRQNLENERDFVDSFLEDSEDSTPCWKTHVIRNFCQTVTQPLSARPQPEVRLDDRERGTNESRRYPAALTAEELRQYLEVGRFGVANLPDADYRQIRIHNLDPESLLALARTSACHQVDTLRDAFAKHISNATSFRVHERVDGFVTPRLELHLPYLALRQVSSASDLWKNRDLTQEGESWLDLPLPDSEPSAADQPDRFLIEKAHISTVLCVWDYSKWVGYAFSKGGPMDKPDHEPEESDGEESDTEDDCSVPKEDVFAPRNVNHDLYAEDPIRDPREYFLRVVDVWIIFILREYTYLVRVLEACVRAWQKEYRRTFSSVSCKRPQESVRQLFDNIVKTVQLLRYIGEQLSLATQAWKDFSDPHGDIKCFRDIRDTHGRVKLRSIKNSFREMVNLEKVIASLVVCCEVSVNDLKLRMGLESQFLNYESNRLNHQSNRLNLESTELQREVALANKENNELQRQAYAANIESNNIQRQAYSINLETQCIRRDMQRLNRQNTLAAQSTSSTTRTNVLMIWITTPFLVALQYFSADQPIFTSFDRSPRNFCISLFILALAFPLLTWAFNSLYDLIDSVISRLIVKKKRNQEDLEANPVSQDVPPIVSGA